MRFNKSKSKGNIVTDGLVLYLDAGIKGSYSGSGTTWTDLAGSNDGTLTNGPTFDSANGGNIVFDGGDDYVEIPSFNVTEITVAAWINLDAGGSVIAAKRNDSNYSWDLSFTDGNILYFGPNNNANRANSGGTTVSTGAYAYCVGTFDGTTVKVFINGAEEGTYSYSGSVASTTTNISFGRRLMSSPNENFLDGNIAIAQIYNRALTAAEITQNFEAIRNRFGI